MTLAEFQPHVDAAITAHEWATARARWAQGLRDEYDAIAKALPLAGQYGIEREPLEARHAQIANALLTQDVTADQVPQHPVRSIPIDLITAAVVRSILRLPVDFPVLSIKTVPDADTLARAVSDIAQRWHTPNAALPTD